MNGFGRKTENKQMEPVKNIQPRRTSVDLIFDHLYQEINSLQLLPGTKISEAEIAARFEVSRQPVRDAFSRLENFDLLLIRPQKATEVRRFSNKAIAKSRFVRASIESEVLRRAAALCDGEGAKRLDKCVQLQTTIVDNEDFEAFSGLDYDFHKTLCEIAGVEFAFEVISSEKAKLDRLCVLGHSERNRLPQLLEDHETIAGYVKNAQPEEAVEAGMLHLSRLDATINKILQDHPDYFEQ